MTPTNDTNILSRFWSKTTPGDNGCIEWIGCITPNGYGLFAFQGKLAGAHRVSWRITHGVIPEGVCVCHRCDNRRCVNPDHLFLGTHKDNADDRESKGRTARRLTDAQITAIRNQFDGKRGSIKRLADQYGVSRTYAGELIRGLYRKG